jgi:hypothetical protein
MAIGRPRTYATVLERIVANSTQAPDNVCGCWIWTGPTRGIRGERPAMSMRRPGKQNPVNVHPLRVLLDCGPLDEASHLCVDEYLCVNPDHAVAESKQANLKRRDGVHLALPRVELGDPDADIDWPPAGHYGGDVCPF